MNFPLSSMRTKKKSPTCFQSSPCLLATRVTKLNLHNCFILLLMGKEAWKICWACPTLTGQFRWLSGALWNISDSSPLELHVHNMTTQICISLTMNEQHPACKGLAVSTWWRFNVRLWMLGWQVWRGRNRCFSSGSPQKLDHFGASIRGPGQLWPPPEQSGVHLHLLTWQRHPHAGSLCCEEWPQNIKCCGVLAHEQWHILSAGSMAHVGQKDRLIWGPREELQPGFQPNHIGSSGQSLCEWIHGGNVPHNGQRSELYISRGDTQRQFLGTPERKWVLARIGWRTSTQRGGCLSQWSRCHCR